MRPKGSEEEERVYALWRGKVNNVRRSTRPLFAKEVQRLQNWRRRHNLGTDIAELGDWSIKDAAQVVIAKGHLSFRRACLLLVTGFKHSDEDLWTEVARIKDQAKTKNKKPKKHNQNDNQNDKNDDSTTSGWKATVMAEMLEYERTTHCTAWPEPYLRKTRNYFRCFLGDLDKSIRSRSIDACMCLETFMRTASVEEWTKTICQMANVRSVRNDYVKSAHNSHSARSYVKWILHFIKGSLAPRISANCASLNLTTLLRKIPNRRVAANPSQRRAYSLEELERMRENTKGPAEDVMLTILIEIGLRNSALRHLKYATLLDEQHMPRKYINVREKGNKIRACQVSPNLATKIEVLSNYWRTRPGGCEGSDYGAGGSGSSLSDVYILNLRHPRRPLSETTVRDKLKRIAKTAHITDVRVHAHAFRHTLIQRLVFVGNSIEIVSKYMGHANTHTTSYFYFVPTPAEIGAVLKNPFLPEFHEKQQKLQQTDDREQELNLLLQAEDAKTQAYRQLLSVALQIPGVIQSCCDAGLQDVLRNIMKMEDEDDYAEHANMKLLDVVDVVDGVDEEAEGAEEQKDQDAELEQFY